MIPLILTMVIVLIIVGLVAFTGVLKQPKFNHDPNHMFGGPND